MDLKQWKKFAILFRKRSKIFLLCSINLAILLTFPLGARVMGGDNEEDYGKPSQITFPWTSDCETNITFGVIADTHLDAHSCSDTGENIHENRGEVDDINTDCKNDGCLAIVHLGDMINWREKDDVVQQLIAFRQLWENDYPGESGGSIRGCSDTDYNAYNNGYKINFPVFPGVGNHDVRNCGDSWDKVPQYISDRLSGQDGIIDNYGRVTYAWRLGRYFFIQLGLWAGSPECEDPNQTDTNKLEWLQNFLKNHVGDSGLGVLIFQHYGWDGFSKNGQWWSDSQRQMELNVLCGQNIDNQGAIPQCKYNILGIFSGHVHSPQNLDIDVYVGKDSNGNDFKFKNFSMRTSGVSSSDEKGFSIVHLDGQKMTIRSKKEPNDWPPPYEQPIYTPPLAGWSEVKRGPSPGDLTAGGGAAIANINKDAQGRPDLLLMAIDDPDGPNQFRYVIGWDLDANGNPGPNKGTNGWSEVKRGPSPGDLTAGGGAAIADIDRNEKPDLVLMAIDDPEGPNQFRYVVGWNLDTSGNPTTGGDCTTAPCWSSIKKGPSLGTYNAGGGAAIADINDNGIPDLLLMGVDSPWLSNQFWYAIGWDLDANGNPTNGWSEVKHGQCVGWYNAGGGAAVANIDGNEKPELVLMAIDNPEGPNQFRYVIGWNLDKNGNPTGKMVGLVPPTAPEEPKSWRDQVLKRLRGY